MVWKCTCKFVCLLHSWFSHKYSSFSVTPITSPDGRALTQHALKLMHSLTQHRKERHLPSVCVHGSSSWKTESVSSSSSDSCSNKNQCVYIPSHKRSKHYTLNKISLLIHNLPTDKHGEYSLSLSPANSISLYFQKMPQDTIPWALDSSCSRAYFLTL